METKAERTSSALFWASCGLLLFFEIFLLFRAFHGGEYQRVIPWDDCDILDLALERLTHAGEAASPLGVFMHAKQLAPHSPIADIQSMLGYLASGGEVWGPYVLNVAPLAFGLWLAWPTLARRSASIVTPLLLVLSFHPLTVFSLTNLKSDWKAGFFAALAIYVFVQASRSKQRRDWMAASALMGLAVLCKLTAFYIPPLALMMLGYFEAVAAWTHAPSPATGGIGARAGQALRSLLDRWRDIAIEGALIAGPYALFFLYGSHSNFNTIAYIKAALSSTWTDGLSYLGRVAYYAPPNNPAWGPVGWLLPAMAAAALGAALQKRQTDPLRGLLLGIPAMILFAAPLIFAKTSNIEFAGLFVGVGLGVTLALAGDVATQGWRWNLAIGALALGATLVSSFNSYRPAATPADLRDQAYAVGVYDTIANQVIALQPHPGPSIDIYYEDLVYPEPNLALNYYGKTRRLLDVSRFDELPKASPHTGRLADFTLVAAPDPGVATVGFRPELFHWTTKNSVATHAFVTRLPNQVLVQSFPWKGGHIELYRRVAPPAAPVAPGSDSPRP